MKFSALFSLALAALCWAGTAFAQQEDPNKQPPAKLVVPNPEAAQLKTTQAKASYVIGRSIGGNMKSQGVDIDLNAMLMGLRDALAGKDSILSDEEIDAAMDAFQKEMEVKAAAKLEGKKKEGADYLAANKKQQGVQATVTGLQYKVVKAGTGAKPKATDTVTVHYRGTLTDGTEFDSSYKRNMPATFPVNGVISGWTEALQMMTVGSKWMLYIPSDLAYGDDGRPPVIPPFSTLVFEVELIGIK